VYGVRTFSLWDEFGDALNPEQKMNQRSFSPTQNGFQRAF